MPELIIEEERTLFCDSLEGHNLIKIFKKLPVVIIQLPDKKIAGQLNSVFNVIVNNRFKSIEEKNELKILDYDTYSFKLQHYVLSVSYSIWNREIKKMETSSYQILLNDKENDLIRDMINF